MEKLFKVMIFGFLFRIVILTTYPKSANIGRAEHPQKWGESLGDHIFKGGEERFYYPLNQKKLYSKNCGKHDFQFIEPTCIKIG